MHTVNSVRTLSLILILILSTGTYSLAEPADTRVATDHCGALLPESLSPYFLNEKAISKLIAYGTHKRRYHDYYKEWSVRFYEMHGAPDPEKIMYRGMALSEDDLETIKKKGLLKSRSYEGDIYFSDTAKIAFGYMFAADFIGAIAVIDSTELDYDYSKRNEYFSTRSVPQHMIKELWILDPKAPKEFPFVKYYSRD